MSNPLDPARIAENLYIVDKHDALIPYKPNRMQRDLVTKLTGRDIVLKYRQGGASTFFVAENFKKAISKRSRIGIMAHDDKTTQKLRRMAQVFWENMPNDIRPNRGLDNASTTSYKNTGSEVTIATAGSSNVGRGGTYGGGFHGSEVAYWKDAQSTMSAILQGVPMHAPIVLESTPNGAQGWFYERCLEALAGNGVWTLHFYEWWWDDDYILPLDEGETLEYTEQEQFLVDKHNLSPQQIKWRRYKQKELLDTFPQEYPEDVNECFLQSGLGVFKLPTEQCYTPLETSAIEGHYYVAGIDWGEDNDFTCMSVFDVTEHREVALYRANKESYAKYSKEIVALCKTWGIKKIIAERNAMGKSAVEHVQNAIQSEEWPINPKTGYPSTPVIQMFYTGVKSKVDIVSQFQIAIQEGVKLLDNKVANAELRAYVKSQTANQSWSYKAEKGHDDTVMARMLANKAAYELR